MIDIRQIELPTQFGMKTVNCYLILGDKVSLIDCGEHTQESYDALVNGLKLHDLKISGIEEIIITHAHVDHIGMAGRLTSECEAIIKVSDLVAPWAADHHTMFSYRESVIDSTMSGILPDSAVQFFRGYYTDFKKDMMSAWTEIPEDRIEVCPIADGTIDICGQSWDVFYAPGHSYTQTCFYKPETRQFLSADMLLKVTPTPVIEPSEPGSMIRQKSILHLLDSYDRLRKMDIDIVYPGHYELINDHITVIDRQVARIHERKEETYKLMTEGLTDFSELFNKLYKGRWHLPALVMMVGYLDLLEEEGRIAFANEGQNQLMVL